MCTLLLPNACQRSPCTGGCWRRNPLPSQDNISSSSLIDIISKINIICKSSMIVCRFSLQEGKLYCTTNCESVTPLIHLHLEMFATTLAVPLFLRLYVQNKIWGGGGLCMSSPANRFFDSVMVAGADLNLDQTRVMSTDAKK